MIRLATQADVPTIVGMYRAQYLEQQFPYRFNAARISMTLSAAITSPDALVMVAEGGVLYGVAFDSPLGIGRVAVEQIIRATQPGDFDAFVSAFEQWAKEQECVRVCLACTNRHQAFARLYGRRGYSLAESTFSKAL